MYRKIKKKNTFSDIENTFFCFEIKKTLIFLNITMKLIQRKSQ